MGVFYGVDAALADFGDLLVGESAVVGLEAQAVGQRAGAFGRLVAPVDVEELD